MSAAFKLKGHDGPVNGQFHALKVQILNPNTAVAFAGNAEVSFDLIKGLHAELNADPTIGVCERLFESYQKKIREAADPSKAPDCEFLVLQLVPDKKKLAHVTSKEILFQSRAYIGDPDEYRRLTGLRRPHRGPKSREAQQPDGTFRSIPVSVGEIEFDEVTDAMEALCSSRQSSSVGAIGDVVTRVVDARISGELEYLQSVEVSISPSEGQSGYSVLASNSGKRGIGIYYRSGKMGYLFIVGDVEPCRVERAETLSQFVEAAKAKYQLDLIGGIWDD